MNYLFVFLFSIQAFAITPEQQQAGDEVCDAMAGLIHTEQMIEKQEAVEKISGVRHLDERRQLAEEFLYNGKDFLKASENPESHWMGNHDYVSDSCDNMDKNLEKRVIKRIQGIKK